MNLKLKVKKAENFFDRLVGLIGSKTFESGYGLMIEPCNAIHMLFMRFSIDAIFIDKGFCIRKIFLNLKPWFGFAVCLGAWAVIEMKSGEASRLKLSVGQILDIEWI